MIIKCPECGHQVSDKAPVCPSCGVEIAGKIIRCPHCGEIHFISDGICPNCHHSLRPTAGNATDNIIDNRPATSDEPEEENTPSDDNTEDPLKEEAAIAKEEEELAEVHPVQAVPITNEAEETARVEPIRTEALGPKNVQGPGKPGGNGGKEEKKSRWPLIVSLIVAIVICLGLLFAYSNGNRNNEEKEYQIAIESRDPAILQSYLDTYKNAPTAHRDSVQALLNAINASDPQWDSIKSSNDVNQLKQYLQKNPNSPHKQEILNKIDELDWQTALKTHDFANYLSLHQNGRHATEAVDSVKLTMDMPASGADRQKAVSAVRNFLVALNSHNEERVKNCFASQVEYFNEKSSVDGNEALNYMAIIYRDAERLNWHVDNADAAKVSKTGEGSGAQYSITMPARLSVNYNSGNNVQSRYNIQAKINGSGLITAIRLVRLAEDKASSSSSESKSSKSESKSSKSSSSSSSEKKSSSSSSSNSFPSKKSTGSSSSKKSSSNSSSKKSSKK